MQLAKTHILWRVDYKNWIEIERKSEIGNIWHYGIIFIAYYLK